MASSRQQYVILQNDVPISKINNFYRNLLATLHTDHALKGELLVKEALPQDSNHQSHPMYSLALDRRKKVSCSNSDVAPLSEDDYEWLAAIGKTIDRWQAYIQGNKLETVKALQVGDKVWVSLPAGDGTPPHLLDTSYCQATVQYIGPLQDTPGRWVGVELKEKQGSCNGAFRDSRYFICEDDHGTFLPASNILEVLQSFSAPPIPPSISTSTYQPVTAGYQSLGTTDEHYYTFPERPAPNRYQPLQGPIQADTYEALIHTGSGRNPPMNQRSPHPPHMDSSGMASHPTWEESSSHMVHQGHQLRVPPHHSGDGSYAMDSYGRVSSHFGNPHGHIPTSKPRMPHQLAVEHHHCDVSSDSDRQNSSPTCSTPTLQGPHSTRKKLLVSSKENQTDRDFYLDDPVVLFDNDGRRVQGVVKWAVPGKERGVNCYIIGIETDRPIKKGKIEGHFSSMNHLFPYPHDCKKHTYLAVPELSVLKEGGGTPGDVCSEAMDHTTPPDATESVCAVASTRSATAAESQAQPTQPLHHPPTSHNLDVGSAVELVDPPGYGTIRWIGKFPDVNHIIAGVELDTRMDGCGDGSWKGEQYFSCRDGHAMFIVLIKLKPDSRFIQQPQGPNQPSMEMSCSCECQLIKDQVTEIKTGLCNQEDNVKEIDCQLGEYKRQLTTLRGQVGSCEGALQAKDQQIERLQSEVQALQQTTTQFQANSFTEKRQLREELVAVKGQVVHFQEELATVRGQVVSCEEAKEELQQTITDLREDHRQTENDFIARLSSIEAQMRALLPPWAIPETELEVTETILGKGAYGEVRVGVYHGDGVAVKRLHTVIASEYYHKMIQREMGIAARLRHPKLVLFIGAVTRGNLTIVTELMETSLRSELEHGRLKEDHILPISRDVACALCYLHSLPDPIIHRDVSSANVLLNSTKGGWVAKLGDYGSANFQAKLQTVGPGCPVYAAPEASRPEEQGPKMDVYSYGVLVLEMCTGTLPDPHDLPVIQQEVHSWGQPKRQLGGLACQCTLQSSDRRPHMRNVVAQLNGM